MRFTLSRSVPGCCASLLACLALTFTACSKTTQEAPRTADTQPAAQSQPAPGAAAAPAGTPGQPAPGQPTGGPTAATVASAPPPAAPPPPPPPPPPRQFTLAAGTVLSVRTNYTLSTDKQSAGDKFEASLAEPIADGNWVIAAEGAPVEGLVVAATKGGRVKGTAQLEVAITGLTLSDGRHIRVETAMAASAAKSEKKKDTGKVAVATGAGAIIGAIAGGGKGAAIGAAVGGTGGAAVVLGTRGGPAEIPARSLMQFQVTKPVQITEKR